MKIIDVVCSAGRTGFYFDDQRAIKQGAGHDGVFYVGQPVTEGFQSIRQAGESISVMLILEDGQMAYGDCAAVQYSGAGGRDPLFLAEDKPPFFLCITFTRVSFSAYSSQILPELSGLPSSTSITSTFSYVDARIELTHLCKYFSVL